MAEPGDTFGPFTLDRAGWRLLREGAPVALQDKALLFLAALMERPGGLWTREELFQRLWPGVFVTDASLFQVARKLRAALDDDPRAPRWIETVQGRGYRFLGVSQPAASPPLPAPATSPSPRALVGREALLSRLAAELKAGPGTWTLTGPGGVGKTSLALALVSELDPALSGGALFCDAAEVHHAGALQAAVAAAIGLDRGAADAPEVFLHALEGLGPALLVVDNLEQIAAPAAALLSGWSARAGSLRLLATSRIRLGHRGERLVDVPPLELPEVGAEGLDALRESSAGALLLRLAERAADRPVEEHDAPALNALVVALGGLPLAIELAAPRLRLLSPSQLLARMSRPLDLLRGAATDRPSRHSALRETISASWTLLNPMQRSALCQIAQFQGPFPAEAAEEILALQAWSEGAFPLDVLCELVDHSLVRRRDPGTPQGLPALLELLPSVREFAREVSTPEVAEAARGRIAAWYGEDARFSGASDLAAVRAQRERANLVAALDWAIAAAEPQLAAGLMRNLSLTLLAHGPLGEATNRLATVGAMSGLPDAARGGLLLIEAEALLYGASPAAAPALLDRAQELLGPDGDAAGDLRWLRVEVVYRSGAIARAWDLAEAALHGGPLSDLNRARLLTLRASAEISRGLLREGLVTLMTALALTERANLPSIRVRIALELGWVRLALGDMAEALRWWEITRAYGAEIGDRQIQARALERRGQALRQQGRAAEAEADLSAAALLFQRGGFPLLEGGCLDQLAAIATHQGRIPIAEERYHRAIALLEASEHWLAAAVCRGNLGILNARMGRLDEAHAQLSQVIARQMALSGNAAVAMQNLGQIELYRGDPARAATLVQAALAQHEADGRALAAAFARTALGQIAMEQGDDASAIPLLEAAISALRANSERGHGLGGALGLIGLARTRLGAVTEATEAFDEAEALLSAAALPEALASARCRRARALLVRGDRRTAAALREGVAAEMARIGVLARGELGWELAALDRELAAGLA